MLRSFALLKVLAFTTPLFATAALSVSACGDSALPNPSVTPPAAPGAPDESFAVRGLRKWSIIGNEVDPGDDTLALEVVGPKDTQFVDVWIDGGPGKRFTKVTGGFLTSVDISQLPPGEHQVLLAANGSETAFVAHSFKRSQPLYVVVTTDWDDADTGDDALTLQESLHREHSELLLTHFVGPYTFTDPSVSEARRDTLVQWLLGMRSEHQDEIGLHLHPYCNFIDQVGAILDIANVECNTEESTVYTNDPSGYTVQVSSYTQDEFTSILLAANSIFEERGLGTPTSFRAGGWTAELNTLRSLQAAGYVVDTSALNWARLEEWNRPFSGTLYRWNKEHWSSIGDTSQPYYPSTEDILVTGPSIVGVLEVPDNGILVDYVETSEMIEIFDANWNGDFLSEPVNYSIGFHPSNFSTVYQRRISKALDHADQFLASKDAGPVRYGRLSDMTKIWKPRN